MKYANVEEQIKALVHYADQVDETHTLALALERIVESAEDVVDIVRCKDCRYNYLDPNNKKVCHKTDRILTPDFFCADGERKE